MVEILLISILVIYVNKKLPKYNFLIFFSILFQFIILLLYRYELNIKNMVVYYSDATYYWENTLNYLNNGFVDSYNIGYVFYSVLIEFLSPSISVVWINISNLLLLILSVIFITILMLDENIRKKNIMYFNYTIMLNPAIHYSLLRNLKDSLFLFLTIFTLFIVYKHQKLKLRWLNEIFYIILIIMFITLKTIRPWGFIIPIILFGIAKFNNKKINIKNIIILLSLLLLCVFLLNKLGYLKIITIWVEVLKNRFNFSIFKILTAPINMILGSGPIRPIFSEIYFAYSLKTAEIFLSLGYFIWWLILPYLINNIKIRNISLLSKLLWIIIIIFVVIYSLAYGGSIESRLTSVLIVLFSAAIFSNNFNHRKDILLRYSFVFIILFLGGIIFGI